MSSKGKLLDGVVVQVNVTQVQQALYVVIHEHHRGMGCPHPSNIARVPIDNATKLGNSPCGPLRACFVTPLGEMVVGHHPDKASCSPKK